MPYKDKERRKQYQAAYQKKHRERLNKQGNEWLTKRKLIDPNYGKQWAPPSKEVRLKSDRVAGRRWRIGKRYGLTVEECDLKLEQQSGLCAICKQPEVSSDPRTGIIRRLAIDHDHLTNQFRGLLCINCNQALGKFKDDILLLESAIAYLKQYRSDSCK